MKLDASDIREGGVYVKKDELAARIVDAIREQRLSYRSFWLQNGEYYTTGNSEMKAFLDWAGREATQDEIHKLDVEGGYRKERENRNKHMRDALAQATDEELLMEVRLRGLKLD